MDRRTPSTENEEIELYLRTYYSLLRSSGEVEVRSLEETHAAMNSSLHPGRRQSGPGHRRVCLQLHALAAVHYPDPAGRARPVRRRVRTPRRLRRRPRLAAGAIRRAPAQDVFRPQRDTGRFHRQRLGYRRPYPHAGGLSDRMEQDLPQAIRLSHAQNAALAAHGYAPVLRRRDGGHGRPASVAHRFRQAEDGCGAGR